MNFGRTTRAPKSTPFGPGPHEKSDIVVVKFGDKYRQWNAAFDAGFAAALGKPMIILHETNLTHALKEVDAAALAVTQTPDQVVRVLDYAINGNL